MGALNSLLQALKTINLAQENNFTKTKLISPENEFLKYKSKINNDFITSLKRFETEIKKEENGS